MTRAVAPSRTRGRWVEVALDLVLAAVAALLGWGVLATGAGDLPAMQALAVYTFYAAAATLLLAIARAVGTDAAVAVADLRHTTALDLGLVVLAGWLTVLGLRAGGDWVVPSLLVAAVGVWFLVRVVRRRST
jgi:hypothetical protein